MAASGGVLCSEKGMTRGRNTCMQRAMEHKRKILKWLIFAYFKEEVVVAYLFQLISCQLKTRAGRMSGFGLS